MDAEGEVRRMRRAHPLSPTPSLSLIAKPSMDDSVRQIVGQVLGRIPSGIWILAVRDAEGRETGMLASWVQQASFEPPQVTVAVNRERYIHPWLEQTGVATLSLLGETQKSLVSHFGNGFHPHEEA